MAKQYFTKAIDEAIGHEAEYEFRGLLAPSGDKRKWLYFIITEEGRTKTFFGWAARGVSWKMGSGMYPKKSENTPGAFEALYVGVSWGKPRDTFTLIYTPPSNDPLERKKYRVWKGCLDKYMEQPVYPPPFPSRPEDFQPPDSRIGSKKEYTSPYEPV
ncbi:hypothetical protein BDP27DRAFT_1418260 [Rhodocollybia butyracea]|uniref:Uncharacterized protein n=1 Tax=Rhodocollybia butyracea TaxID=206335 RepID=A0A9P5Q2G5_9AGAR|nr:hypothetical protein BDP27DRAFT_1418260 [Rhodocollybia butyracea]